MEFTDPVIQNLHKFAHKHDIQLITKGDIGFGRPCVGFLKRENYISYNPYTIDRFEPVWPDEDKVYPPDDLVPDAYHKHDCLAVLVHNDDYDKALVQLSHWVDYLESQGEVYIEEFNTGATGLQALFSGKKGLAVRIR